MYLHGRRLNPRLLPRPRLPGGLVAMSHTMALAFVLVSPSPSASSFHLVSLSVSPSSSSCLQPRLTFVLVSSSAPSACHCRFAWSSHPRLQHIWICNCKRVERNVSINIANEGGGHCLVDEGGRAFVLTFVSPWAATCLRPHLAFGLVLRPHLAFGLVSPLAHLSAFSLP